MVPRVPQRRHDNYLGHKARGMQPSTNVRYRAPPAGLARSEPVTLRRARGGVSQDAELVSAENNLSSLAQEDPVPCASHAAVTAAIVTYCSSKELPACLDSLLASTIPVKAVVIDNGSTDATLDIAHQYARRHRNVVAIASGGNLGLAAGNNVVIPHLQGDYALMLNPDTVLERDTLAMLVSALEADPAIAVIGPQCLYEDGAPHTSYHYGWTLWHLFVWRVLPYSLVRRLYDALARYRETDVGFVSGACLLVRAGVFREIGGYDPRYFLTVEDVCDLCIRIRARGYRVVFTPRTRITHLCGRSGAQVPYLSTLEGYRGDVYHFLKHGGRLRGYAAYAIVVVACALKAMMSLFKAMIRHRAIDYENLRVYRRILPRLILAGPNIAYSTER